MLITLIIHYELINKLIFNLNNLKTTIYEVFTIQIIYIQTTEIFFKPNYMNMYPRSNSGFFKN